jgi:hypothetical protein
MERQHLARRLKNEILDDRYYEIEGVQGTGRLYEGGLRLARNGAGQWYIATVERGTEYFTEVFDSEAAACQSLYDRLTKPRRVPVPIRPEEAEEVAAREREALANTARRRALLAAGDSRWSDPVLPPDIDEQLKSLRKE